MPTVKVETRLGIPVPAHIVWEAISDLSQWAQWNPTYPRAEGRLSIGAAISMDERLPGSSEAKRQDGVLIDWVPDAQLLWKLKPAGGVKTLRYVEIEKLSDDGVIFANGALLEGWRARFISKHARHALRQGFEAMNEAVKTRAEEMWRQARQDPTSRP
jgi:hypothetical protein